MQPIPPFPPSVAPPGRTGVPVPDVEARTVVLVEGQSDRAAVHAAAVLSGLDLVAADAVVLSMGGATNIHHFLRRLGRDHTVLGLYDSAEAAVFGRALADTVTEDAPARSRIWSGDPNLLAQRGFQGCHRDLEDELIRAVGAEGVIEIIAATGELRAWHSLRNQPAQRDRPIVDQLRRWLGSGSTRKIRYAPLLVAALPPDRLPHPLRALLERIGAPITRHR